MSIRTLGVVVLLFAMIPRPAAGQTADTARPALDRFTLQVGAGPLLKSGGHVLSGSFGFSPISRLDLVVNVERQQVPFQRDTFDGIQSVTRGGTLTSVSGELRASLLPPDRVSPYGFVGFGGGISRPTVNDTFPTVVENDLRVVYAGGGVRIPIRGGLSVFGDARAMMALEGPEGIMGLWPVRAGLSWRF